MAEIVHHTWGENANFKSHQNPFVELSTAQAEAEMKAGPAQGRFFRIAFVTDEEGEGALFISKGHTVGVPLDCAP